MSVVNFLLKFQFISCLAIVLDPLANITITEMSSVIISPHAEDANNDDLTYAINSPWFQWQSSFSRFVWITGATSAGEFDFLVNVTDGELWDTEPIHVTVEDTCVEFDKDNWCWVNCTCKGQEYEMPSENLR